MILGPMLSGVLGLGLNRPQIRGQTKSNSKGLDEFTPKESGNQDTFLEPGVEGGGCCRQAPGGRPLAPGAQLGHAQKRVRMSALPVVPP